MGALHEGHLALVKNCKNEADIAVVSIFVNPIQFNNTEDLKKYPRSLDRDAAMLEAQGVDMVFAPEVEEVYPEKVSVSIGFGAMGDTLEGAFRPGHFDGVGVVVAKLFNVILPDYAYFGLKDLQQFLLIRNMVRDLNFPVQLRGIDTVRAENGLALSSRNARLSDKGRQVAVGIYKGLERAGQLLESGMAVSDVKEAMNQYFLEIPEIEVEYLALVNPATLEEAGTFSHDSELAICFAGFVEGVRLIDNLYLRSKLLPC